ncbi:kinase-like domain-containing protein [Radiomyces spectabilis]|uniref:kinase-like domain-containing protein n=1 Tax=Radiomyces spectabilis TaxID=64574 RepID=UPI00221EE72F|nr:kinase-like domain-containing protein [Radiomyces spectabilis]KAI8384618.1 kinase-like domain-containing protein [Radiomyces spectabilis]
MPPSAIFPHPTLHNPSRFLPQNQAILTTYDDWHIILSNNIAAFVLVGDAGCDKSLVGKSVLDFIDPSFRTRFQDMVHKRRQELNYLNEDSLAGGMVLVCGNVLPIVKQDGSKSAASLWLKEKRNDAGKSVYIWVFEEGIIRYVDEGVQEVYDYTPSELVGQSIQVLIPSFDLEQPLRDWQENQYFGGRTKRGANFPIIAKMHMMSTSKTDSGAAAISSLRSAIRITSIPMIAGLVTVRQNGIIVGCNNVFVQYMFGFSQEELITGQLHIATLMPQFPTLLRNLQRDDLLQHGFIINSAICRKLIADTHIDDSRLSYLAPSSSPSAPHTTSTQTTAREPRLTHAPNGQALPVILAIHRDGTPFEVQLQLRLVDGSDDALALWITFNRDATFARFGHTAYARPSLELKQHNGLAMRVITNNVYRANREPLFSPVSPTASNHVTAFPTYSAQTQTASIDDYHILDDLGEGAYGLVKLAVRKNDPEKKKVVIKYVIKSRILVDCWTRDRKLGTIPAEIHILHTLRKIPHPHCAAMIDYFEDDDHYYIIMPLHGDGMDLFDYIELKPHMAEFEIKSIFRQVADAVRHLHDHSIVHRDIKDENVILDGAGAVRLIDFGSAAYMKAGRRFDTFFGTLEFSSPEVLRGHTYEGPPQDVWALGILLYTLICRENPFYDVDEIMGGELRWPTFEVSKGNVNALQNVHRSNHSS